MVVVVLGLKLGDNGIDISRQATIVLYVCS